MCQVILIIRLLGADWIQSSLPQLHFNALERIYAATTTLYACSSDRCVSAGVTKPERLIPNITVTIQILRILRLWDDRIITMPS